MARPQTEAGEYRIYTVATPFMSRRPALAWADVKVTAKQAKIIAWSDRSAWGYKTVIDPTRYARSASDAWARHAEGLRQRIARAEQDIAQCRENLARIERDSVAESDEAQSSPTPPRAPEEP